MEEESHRKRYHVGRVVLGGRRSAGSIQRGFRCLMCHEIWLGRKQDIREKEVGGGDWG